MDAGLSAIKADLARHADLFDLSKDGLGSDALDLAVNGVKDHFDAEVNPDGQPWPDLSTDYGRWKQKHYPGQPIGVLKGLMKAEIPGEPEVNPDSAEWTYGKGDEAKKLATWFQEGDEEQNRPERRFADLNAESIGKSDQLFDNHFEKGTS